MKAGTVLPVLTALSLGAALPLSPEVQSDQDNAATSRLSLLPGWPYPAASWYNPWLNPFLNPFLSGLPKLSLPTGSKDNILGKTSDLLPGIPGLPGFPALTGILAAPPGPGPANPPVDILKPNPSALAAILPPSLLAPLITPTPVALVSAATSIPPPQIVKVLPTPPALPTLAAQLLTPVTQLLSPLPPTPVAAVAPNSLPQVLPAILQNGQGLVPVRPAA